MNINDKRGISLAGYTDRYVVPALMLIGAALTACLPRADSDVVNPVDSYGQDGTLMSEQPVLLVAPDRGFMGNEEIREALNGIEYANKHVVFITDDASARYLQAFQTEQVEAGAKSLTVLPLFLSEQAPKWQWTHEWLENNLCAQISCRHSEVFGASYYAVEALSEALRDSQRHGSELVVLSSGADDESSARILSADLQRLTAWATQGLHFSSYETVMWTRARDNTAWEQQTKQLQQQLAGANRLIVSYHLGQKLDGMMSLDNSFALIAQAAGNDLVVAPITGEWLTPWLQREVNRSQLDRAGAIGVVVHAHGSDFHWNETMRAAVRPLENKYLVEYAFSMADQATIATALARLEERGAKGAVVVRVFGREDSFQTGIERMLGMDVEQGGEPSQATLPMQAHGAAATKAGRIQTSLVVTSVGGLEAHPLFAQALLERARALSEDPARETLILVAHGTGDDEANDVWLENLRKLADQINELSGGAFRHIDYATWREDWPNKRQTWIEKVRAMVQTAQQDQGTALVIPARTNATGPEEEFLEGLDFKLGEGFAPHPLFAQWVESQMQAGASVLRKSAGPSG